MSRVTLHNLKTAYREQKLLVRASVPGARAYFLEESIWRSGAYRRRLAGGSGMVIVGHGTD